MNKPHEPKCDQNDTLDKKNLGELTDSEKERIGLIKHVTTLAVGISASVYIIIGIIIATIKDTIIRPVEDKSVGDSAAFDLLNTITKDLSELTALDIRISFILVAFALFHVAIIVGIMLILYYIEKHTSNQAEYVGSFIMAFCVIMGVTFLFIYVITISWTIAASTLTIVAVLLHYAVFPARTFRKLVSLLIAMFFYMFVIGFVVRALEFFLSN